jgi:hypothetical protein
MGSIDGAIEAVVARPIDRFKQLDYLKRQAPKDRNLGRSRTKMTARVLGRRLCVKSAPGRFPQASVQTGYHTSKAMASSRATWGKTASTGT